jgi:hypothetical protein
MVLGRIVNPGHRLAVRCGRIDVQIEDDDLPSLLPAGLGEGREVDQRPREAVKLRHQQRFRACQGLLREDETNPAERLAETDRAA